MINDHHDNHHATKLARPVMITIFIVIIMIIMIISMMIMIITITPNLPGMPSSVAPATADVIALQSQVS